MVDIGKLILKYRWKGKGPRIAKIIWKTKKKELKDSPYMMLKLYLKLSNQNNVVLVKRSMESIK